MISLLLLTSSCSSGLKESTHSQELTFSPAKLPPASVGQTYSEQITVSNEITPVFSMEIIGTLPSGLEFDYDYGTPANDYAKTNVVSTHNFAKIKGVPRTVGKFKFFIRADCLGTTSREGQTNTTAYEIIVN